MAKSHNNYYKITLASIYAPPFVHVQIFPSSAKENLYGMSFFTLGLFSQGVGCCCRLLGRDDCFLLGGRDQGAGNFPAVRGKGKNLSE